MKKRFFVHFFSRLTSAAALAVAGPGWSAPGALPTRQGLPVAGSWLAARKHPFAGNPGLRSLNPWYLRIVAAVVAHSQPDMQKYAQQMQKFAADKTKPYLWFPATRARTFCLVWLEDEAAFVHSFALLCHARGVSENKVKVIIFAQRIFAVLAKQKRAAWVRAAVAQGLPASGPAPGKLYMYLLHQRLGQMRSPIAKRQLIQASIGQAIIAVQSAKKVVLVPVVKSAPGGAGPGRMVMGYPARYYRYRRNLEMLRFMAVISDTQGLTTVDLCRDAQNYFAIYGAKGRYSTNVFYTVLNQLYLVHRVLPQPVQKQRILAQGAWLGDWYAKITAQPSPLVKQIQARWQEWQGLR